MNKARILYAVGSVLLVIMGIAHFYEQFGPKGFDIQRSLIEQAMKEYQIQGIGSQYSLMDVMQCWGVFFGILTAVYGVLNLLILIESLPPASMIRFSLFSVVCLAVLISTGAMYGPFTAAVFFLIFLCFALSAFFFNRKKKETIGIT